MLLLRRVPEPTPPQSETKAHMFQHIPDFIPYTEILIKELKFGAHRLCVVELPSFGDRCSWLISGFDVSIGQAVGDIIKEQLIDLYFLVFAEQIQPDN